MRRFVFLLSWSELFLLAILVIAENKHLAIDDMKGTWENLAGLSHDFGREERLQSKAATTKGIYINGLSSTNSEPRYGRSTTFHEEFSKHSQTDSTFQIHGQNHTSWNPYLNIYKPKDKARLQNTVLIIVWESREVHDQYAKYRQLFFNLLCYLQYYQLKAMVYIIETNKEQYLIDKESITSTYPFVEVMDYPYELFWRLVSKKTSNITLGSGKADYQGNIPSFRHFGALPMLVPTLELLQLGYNTIYFDTDVAFLEDPIPFLIRGDADITVSQEIKSCHFSSFSYNPSWENLEANTGIMFVQSNSHSIKFFENWLLRIIDGNVMNDQRVLNLGEKSSEAIWTKSCDFHFEFESSARKDQMINKYEHMNVQNDSATDRLNSASPPTSHDIIV